MRPYRTQWDTCFSALLHKHTLREDKAGTFARRLVREGEALWAFLDVLGVEPTNMGLNGQVPTRLAPPKRGGMGYRAPSKNGPRSLPAGRKRPAVLCCGGGQRSV